MPTNGLVVMIPTSVAKTGAGSTATIGANGKVTFSAIETLSLNGVFTSSYESYMIVYRGFSGSNGYGSVRLRASGTDATGSNYTSQLHYADGTTVAASRGTLGGAYTAYLASNLRHGYTMFVFGPYLARATGFSSVPADSYLSAEVLDIGSVHSLTSSYDGCTVLGGATTFTGEITVYGFNQ